MHIKEPDSFKTLIYTCKDDDSIAYKTKTRNISYASFFKDVISTQKIFLNIQQGQINNCNRR